MFDNIPAALDLATTARDIAEMAMLHARDRSGSAFRALNDARSALASAKAGRAALVQAALEGKAVDPAGLRKADKAIDDAEQSVRFHTDVARAADDAFRMATDAHKQTCTDYHLQQLAAEQQQINDDMHARVPEQPSDDDLASLARRGALIGVEAEVKASYHAAYHRYLEPGPIYVPRQRIILEGQTWQAWMQWARTAEPTENWLGAAPGATERSLVRQMRVCLAARDHFRWYLELGWDDLRRLHGQDYARIQAGLPQLRSGMVAPCAFAPL
jgi:hypothetical protein